MWRSAFQRIIPYSRVTPARSFSLANRLASSQPADLNAFGGSCTGTFVQPQPELGNQYVRDPLLHRWLKQHLPKDVLDEIHEDLINFGESVATTVLNYHNDVCNTEPLLQQYNAWGQRVDTIIMHPSWRALHDVAAKEGLISIPYVNKYSEWSRLYQISKLYMFGPSSGLYSCPLAMTDGAAGILRTRCDKEPFCTAFSNLTSNDPGLFWTSGQWMTEKRGGSDVGEGTETLAVEQCDGTYKLHGYKWFTSATDADMTLTLARVVDERGNMTRGSRGLTMFYLQTRNSDGCLNGIRIEKLKKKLGTRQMPTAELILDGAVAHRVSDIGRGIAAISPMLTITRIHNSVMAVSCMRRMLNLSVDYAQKRKAFGEQLNDVPLHNRTLARLEVEQRAAFHLLFKVSTLLGLLENNKASDANELLLRILTPLLKLYTGKQSVASCSEGLESFGGAGYLEDTGLPVMLRDAQVLSIWEGTTNVLSLDVLRAIQKSNGECLKVFFKEALRMLSVNDIRDSTLSSTQKKLTMSLHGLIQFCKRNIVEDRMSYMANAARDFSYSLVRVYMGCLLFSDSVGVDSLVEGHIQQSSIHVVHRWCHEQDLTPVLTGEEMHCYDESAALLDSEILYGTKYSNMEHEEDQFNLKSEREF